VHDAEFVAADRLLQDTPVGGLGPDLLSPGFDADEALRRFKSRSDDTMADALLDQRVMAGVGNVYKSEVLFLAGVHPFAAVAASDESKLRDMIGIAQRLLLDNVVERPGPGMVTYKSARRTTGRMRSEDRLWVYSRSGKPCRKCGTPIAFDKHGDAARVTYWCPACQPMR
jgi:endonuclease-8